MQDFNPILCFRCFFESNVQFEDKVWTALGLHGFAQISPYACATSQTLLAYDKVFVLISQPFAHAHNTHRKRLALIIRNTLPHIRNL